MKGFDIGNFDLEHASKTSRQNVTDYLLLEKSLDSDDISIEEKSCILEKLFHKFPSFDYLDRMTKYNTTTTNVVDDIINMGKEYRDDVHIMELERFDTLVKILHEKEQDKDTKKKLALIIDENNSFFDSRLVPVRESVTIDEMIYFFEGFVCDGNGEILNEASIKKTVKKISFTERKLAKRLDSKINKAIKDHRERSKKDSYDRIIKRSFKLSRLIKTVIMSGVATLLVGPVITALGLITKVVLNKKSDNKHKQRILNELKVEQKIVEEKISQAEKNGDDKAKIKLMRLNEELKRDIDRIRYNLPH